MYLYRSQTFTEVFLDTENAKSTPKNGQVDIMADILATNQHRSGHKNSISYSIFTVYHDSHIKC